MATADIQVIIILVLVLVAAIILLIILKFKKLMADLSKLQASVDANKDAVAAVAAYVGTLSAADQPAIDSLQAEVDANTAALKAILPPAPAPAPGT